MGGFFIAIFLKGKSTMQSIQQLRERHASLAKETRELVEKHNGEWKAEHQSKYDQGLAELDDIKAQIDRAERVLAAASDEVAEGKINEAKEKGIRAAGRELFAKWLQGGDKALSA